jgi:hypothetical protein
MLCTTAASNEHMRIVNRMSVSHALQITHFLHGQLSFRVVASSEAAVIHPFPIPSDVVDACDSGWRPVFAELDLRCGRARRPEGIAWIYKDREAAEALASLLNKMYGVR